ncbi:MAG: hypothetical protein ACPHK0_01250 [Dehalococcoidia bacterium]
MGSSSDTRMVLTHNRVLISGSKNETVLHASIPLTDISSIEVSSRPRARRSAAWGVVGLFAAVGVWQVTPDARTGFIAGIAVALIALLLIGDYWVRPAGVHISIRGKETVIQTELGSRSEQAVEFAAEVENARRKMLPGRLSGPWRNYPTG